MNVVTLGWTQSGMNFASPLLAFPGFALTDVPFGTSGYGVLTLGGAPGQVAPMDFGLNPIPGNPHYPYGYAVDPD